MTSVSDPLAPAPPTMGPPMQNLEVEEVVMMTTNETFTEGQHNMLERLSKNPSLVVASQQRDEPDLSAEQKLDKLKQLLSQHPDQFLARFGKYVKYEELECFREFDGDQNDDGFGVAFHLKELEKSLKDGSIVVLAGALALNKQLKNRRYEALKKLVETTDYFSEEEMQRRNPILYDQLIGKYHTEQERAAFLQQSYKSTSGSGTTTTPLTDLFLAHLDRTTEGISCRRMAQESQQNEEDEADAEYDTDEDEDYDMEGSGPGPSSLKVKRNARPRRTPNVNDDDAPREEIEDEEKDLLKEEFFTTMYRDFLNGKDDDFDYSTVDDNPDYDCGEDLENDEEEKYFDVEEPAEVSEPNSDLDDLFRPPVRSGEIESKIEKLSVAQSQSENVCTIENQDQSSVLMTGNEEEEDELDAYMREIEKQLKN